MWSWRVCGWQEGQTDKRSRWHPGGCCRVGGWGLVGAALSRSTCHLPRPTVTASQWQRGNRGTEEEKCTTTLENLQIAFITVLDVILAVETAPTGLAPAPVVNCTTVVVVWYRASSAYINGSNKFGEQNLDLSPTHFNLHKPTSVLQHRVKWKDWPCLHRDLMSHSANLIWHSNLWNS